MAEIPDPTPHDLERDLEADLRMCQLHGNVFGSHDDYCACMDSVHPADCDCGLDQARAALPAAIRRANHAEEALAEAMTGLGIVQEQRDRLLAIVAGEDLRLVLRDAIAGDLSGDDPETLDRLVRLRQQVRWASLSDGKDGA